MFRNWWAAICLTSLSACSTAPDLACPLAPALTAPAPPLAAPDALRAPLSLEDAYTLWLDDIRRYNDLRERHAALADEARRCLKRETPPEV